MSLHITSPITGTVIALSDVPDPVFAGEIVGPGAAVDPGQAAMLSVAAPVAGTVSSLKPHAFVIQTESGQGVLVHLGIDTVELDGAGFTLRAQQGATVAAGEPLLDWSTEPARQAGKSLVVPVIALEAEASALTITGASKVNAGDELIEMV